MSAYFNKKEEVIEIELTQYGKHLLSKGEFKPTFYSFFDDDVVYDAQYTGTTEEQNYSEDRILEETPSTKIQYVFSGRETSISEINDHIRNNRYKLREKAVQQTPEKHYALSAPLGNSTHINSNAPSWNVTSLLGKFNDRVEYQQGAQPTLKIPQIELNDYKCISRALTGLPQQTETLEGNQVLRAGDLGDAGSASDSELASIQFMDGSYIDIVGTDILIEVGEENTECLRENFDIEVYAIEEVDSEGNIITPGAAASEKYEKLVPLKFGKRFTNIVNNILNDEERTYGDVINYDATFVEHFLKIDTDKDIDKELLCKAGVKPSSTKCGGFTRDFLECGENERIVGRVYKQVTKEDMGEDC